MPRPALLVLCAALLTSLPAVGEDRPAVPGGVYDKPYLTRALGGTAVGGYIDHELFWNDAEKAFDQHRFIPFLFGEVNERIHVSAEIEFEHGGNLGEGGELKLEFATLDIAFHEAATLRGGVILSPLGRFNLLHDSPLNDLTNRPLVAREIIPTTLSESGMGFFGTFYPSEEAVAGYELYVVNGFDGETADRIRSGRGNLGGDNNEEKSIVGRLNYSPFLGVEVGGSFHVGAYDDAGDHNLTIWALDGSWNRGAFDLRGEFAAANVDGAAEDSRSGYYGQAAYHFLHGALPNFPASVVTAAARYDYIDLGGTDETRYTVGLNVRPVEETALKLDYEVYDRDEDRTGFILSMTSYF
jgi:hypothetical protein